MCSVGAFIAHILASASVAPSQSKFTWFLFYVILPRRREMKKSMKFNSCNKTSMSCEAATFFLCDTLQISVHRQGLSEWNHRFYKLVLHLFLLSILSFFFLCSSLFTTYRTRNQYWTAMYNIGMEGQIPGYETPLQTLNISQRCSTHYLRMREYGIDANLSRHDLSFKLTDKESIVERSIKGAGRYFKGATSHLLDKAKQIRCCGQMYQCGTLMCFFTTYL